jgi:NADPH:quinone reductase-like Zn-dependent oxidoreductase
MKAVGLYKCLTIEDPQSLVDLDIPEPNHPAREHDLLVAIKAISVNPVDTKVRRGLIPPNRRKSKKYTAYIRMGCCWRSSKNWFRLHTF